MFGVNVVMSVWILVGVAGCGVVVDLLVNAGGRFNLFFVIDDW